MAGDLEGVGGGLVGVGGSFALGSGMGYGRTAIELGDIGATGPGRSQAGAIAMPRLVQE